MRLELLPDDVLVPTREINKVQSTYSEVIPIVLNHLSTN